MSARALLALAALLLLAAPARAQMPEMPAGYEPPSHVCRIRVNFDDPAFRIEDDTERIAILREKYITYWSFSEVPTFPVLRSDSGVSLTPINAAHPPQSYVDAGYNFRASDGYVLAAPLLGERDGLTSTGPLNEPAPFQDPEELPGRLYLNWGLPVCSFGYSFQELFSGDTFDNFLAEFFSGVPVEQALTNVNVTINPVRARNAWLEHIKVRNTNNSPDVVKNKSLLRVEVVHHDKATDADQSFGFGDAGVGRQCALDEPGTRVHTVYAAPAGPGREQKIYIGRDSASGFRFFSSHSVSITELAYSLEVEKELCDASDGEWVPIGEADLCYSDAQCDSGNDGVVDRCIEKTCVQTALVDCALDPECRATAAYAATQDTPWCLRDIGFDEEQFGGEEGVLDPLGAPAADLGLWMQLRSLTFVEDFGVFESNFIGNGFRLLDTARISEEDIEDPLASPGVGPGNGAQSQGLVVAALREEGGDVVTDGEAYQVNLDLNRPATLLALTHLNPRNSSVPLGSILRPVTGLCGSDFGMGTMFENGTELVQTQCTSTSDNFFSLTGAQQEFFAATPFNALVTDQIGKPSTVGLRLYFNGNQEALAGMRYLTADAECVGGTRVSRSAALVETLLARSAVFEDAVVVDDDAVLGDIVAALMHSMAGDGVAPPPPALRTRPARWTGTATALVIVAAAAVAVVAALVAWMSPSAPRRGAAARPLLRG